MFRARWVLLPVLLAAAPLPGLVLNLKLASTVPSGPGWGSALFGSTPVADVDQDGLLEVFFSTGITSPADPLRWEAWEYRALNSWELVFADTGGYPYPPGITTGNLLVWAVGDVDRDGLPDVVGHVAEQVGDTIWHTAAIIESTVPDSYPTRLAWISQRWRILPQFVAYTDLDQDDNCEVFVHCNGRSYLWEARGDDSLVPIELPQAGAPSAYAFGDFDGDSLLEYATGFFATYVFENVAVGVDSYALVFEGSTGMGNGADVFSGDVDGDGRPEFFIGYLAPGEQSLVMWQATGNNSYQYYPVGFRSPADPQETRGTCGDLDGDGVDELVWVNTGEAAVYKALPGNRFELVWRTSLRADMPHRARVADANGNGYGELLLTEVPQSPSVREIRVFEVEAVRMLYPNGGQEFQPGDTCPVRWRRYEPPACDSVSLFFLADTVVPPGEWFWRMDTIATGLAPTESSYAWVVPDTVLDAAWIVAIAYGPGWQYDRSDSTFAIVPAGIAGEPPAGNAQPVLPTLAGRMLVLPGREPADLLDVTGRRVLALLPGRNDLSGLAPGVYFVLTPSPQPSGTAGPGAAPSKGEGADGRARAEGFSVRRVVVLK